MIKPIVLKYSKLKQELLKLEIDQSVGETRNGRPLFNIALVDEVIVYLALSSSVYDFDDRYGDKESRRKWMEMHEKEEQDKERKTYERLKRKFGKNIFHETS